ncbi:uncharacterized protein L203_102924 [Cryptococcus depauperatus CBS 7841]|uniref:Disintegrin and metalloproteinase domain-containing protein B n=1 Tax=Cryptococcus depauperatus CBS 7841 TaxID=1295531 RepID=A0A1E3IB58_9TREE|nr:hypothetical protein L203_04729 [Cryptococcus depauperatus CBS 7841]
MPWLLSFLIVTLLLVVDARSPHPPPLGRIAVPKSSLSILPRRLNKRYASSLPPPPPTLKHDDSLVLTLDVPEIVPERIVLFLEPESDLIHPNAQIVHGDSQLPLLQQDYRLYNGYTITPSYLSRLAALHSISARPPASETRHLLGRASVMVHHPGDLAGQGVVWEGSFQYRGDVWNVLTRDKYERVKTLDDVDVKEMGEMVVFRQSDMSYHTNTTESQLCSHDALPFNAYNPPTHNFLSPLSSLGLFRKRDDTAGGMTPSTNYKDTINSTAGCPNMQKIVYMGVALDCNYVSTYGSTDLARIQVLNSFNQVSALYKSTFNVSLGIIQLVVQNATCPTTPVEGEAWNVGCGSNITLDERLSRFSAWRGRKSQDGAGLWHLMSACPTDSEVGVAWLGTLCQSAASQQNGQTVSGTGISTATKTEWSLVAHEVGHGFGAIHDCTSSCSLSSPCCPLTTSSCSANGRFIMNPTTSSSEQIFSGCTLGNVCTNLGNRVVDTSCLESPGGRSVVSLKQCGNGIVEDGEDCDPGGNVTSACCDSSTCKFKPNAKCDPSNSLCCTSQCHLAPANTSCRAAVHPICDIPETCSGTSAECPKDKTEKDGKSCGADGLQCASGQCTSLSKQCLLAGGSLGLNQGCGQKDDKSCLVSCKDPNSTNQCVILQTPLVDGSPCGYAGHCYNSTCSPGIWQDVVSSWYQQNLQISVPVTVVAGLFIIAIIVALTRCLIRSCRSRSKPTPHPRFTTQIYPSQPLPPRAASSAQNPPLFGTQDSGVSVSSNSGEALLASQPQPVAQGQGQPMNDPSRFARQSAHTQSQSYIHAPQSYYENYGNEVRTAGGDYGRASGKGDGYRHAPYQGVPPGGQGEMGWVDARAYNEEYYGRPEANRW